MIETETAPDAISADVPPRETPRETSPIPETLPRSVGVKSTLLFGALCYLGGVVVGVRVSQMMHQPCPCEEEAKAAPVASEVIEVPATMNGAAAAEEPVGTPE